MAQKLVNYFEQSRQNYGYSEAGAAKGATPLERID